MEENMNIEAVEEQALPAGEPSREEGQEAELAAHVAEMRERFPQVDIIRLEQNPAFRRFAGSRYGRESLAQLYEDFSQIMREAEQNAQFRAEAKRSRDTGGSGGGKSSGVLSAGEREALRRWNDANPDMKMSEKEFLERS